MLLSLGLQEKWQGKDQFAEVFALEGEVFRQHKNRRTLRFHHADKAYFVKIHRGIGWKEIIKNLLQGRLPVISARPEWQAIQFVENLHIPTLPLAGYGVRGKNPAKLESFLLTEEIAPAISLEEFCKNWQAQPPSTRLKRQLIKEVARIAATIHRHGLNHRDFYLCHFLLDLSAHKARTSLGAPKLYLIDLHRAQIRQRVPLRWQLKDLGGLYFSCLQLALPLTQHDLLVFMQTYAQHFSGKFSLKEQKFWQRVKQRALKTFRQELAKKFAYEQIQHGFWRCVPEHLSLPMLTLLCDPEHALQQFPTEMLKAGDTTTVIKITIAGQSYVVKRYNTRNFWHGIRKLFKPSRAAKCWYFSHTLLALNIATTRPVAMLEIRQGFLQQTAYFITEYVAAETAMAYLQKANAADPVIQALAQKLARLLKKLFHYGFCHGDLKATNILLVNAVPVLIDLDGMAEFAFNEPKFQRACRKDIQRFLKNWHGNDSLSKLFLQELT